MAYALGPHLHERTQGVGDATRSSKGRKSATCHSIVALSHGPWVWELTVHPVRDAEGERARLVADGLRDCGHDAGVERREVVGKNER